MALRIKCKCGKSLKVSSKLADKKLLCPGCNKAFRIPAEKFKEAPDAAPARAAVIVKKPPASKPPTEVPMPAPVELDLLPEKIDWSSGDLSVSQSDILSGLIPDAKATASSPSGKLGLTCPLCRRTLAPGAVICMDCGFNVTTRTYIKSSLPPRAAAVASAPTAAYASDRSWQVGTGTGRLDRDVVHGPKRSFWGDAFAAYGYPFRNAGNAITFGIVIFIYLLEIPLGYVGCYGLIGIFFIEGWLAALYLSVVVDSAAGSSDLPGIKMEDGVVEDIIKPFFKYLGAFACVFLPAAAYIFLMYFGALPTSLASGVNLMILVAAAVFFWPISLLLFSFNALDMIIRVDLVFTTVFRTFLPYLCMWLMLLLVGFVKFLPLVVILVAHAGLNIPLPSLPQFGGVVGTVVFTLLDLYLGIICMRLVGLYYLHFKKRFTLVME